MKIVRLLNLNIFFILAILNEGCKPQQPISSANIDSSIPEVSESITNKVVKLKDSEPTNETEIVEKENANPYIKFEKFCNATRCCKPA